MKKLILALIKRHNKKCPPEERLEVVRPETFIVSTESDISVKEFNPNSEFIQAIIQEKKYDLREILISNINKEGLIKENVVLKDKKMIIELEIKIFKNETN